MKAAAMSATFSLVAFFGNSPSLISERSAMVDCWTNRTRLPQKILFSAVRIFWSGTKRRSFSLQFYFVQQSAARTESFVAPGRTKTEVTVDGVHFVQEDSPEEIGAAVADFVRGLREDMPQLKDVILSNKLLSSVGVSVGSKTPPGAAFCDRRNLTFFWYKDSRTAPTKEQTKNSYERNN
jgi:hypothetical protein